MARLITTVIAAFFLVAPLHAAVTQRELASVDIVLPSHATLPLSLPLRGEDGAATPIQVWLANKPSVWVLADYTCETLCGPVLSIVADALVHSGLRPGIDFRLIVVGLDPKDTAADAANMKQTQIGAAGSMHDASIFLRGDAAAVAELTNALGFHSVYDRGHDQFAHPAAAFVVAPDGRVVRALAGLAVDPASIRLAVVEASQGAVGTLTDHVRLLCYGYDPASGTYSVAIGRVLAASGGATIAALILLIGLLLRRERAKENETNARHLPVRARTPTIG